MVYLGWLMAGKVQGCHDVVHLPGKPAADVLAELPENVLAQGVFVGHPSVGGEEGAVHADHVVIHQVLVGEGQLVHPVAPEHPAGDFDFVFHKITSF